MAFVSLGRVAQALTALKRFHPFFGITFLSMKESGVTTGEPINWGSPQEQDLLARYYTPEGAPKGKEFYVPFEGPDQEHGFWKNPKYSGGSLQRARTTDRFKDALRHPTKKTWAFSGDYIQQLKSLLPGSADEDRLPLNDLIAWFSRNQDVPADLPRLQQQFITQFKLTTDELGALFDIGSEDPDSFFFDEVLDDGEFNRLIGGVPRGASFAGRSEEELITHLVNWVRDRDKIILPSGFVESVYFSLKTQPFLVLAGRPGTAKTTFARSLAAAFADFFGGAVNEIAVSIGKEFTEADVVGYEKISGELAATDLTKRLFLAGRGRDIYVVILDEMNLSEVDSYFARLLPAIESGSSVELPGLASPIAAPTDTFVIGTVNSYLEEPTRLPLSGPVKRRANIVEMPNHLTTIVSDGDRQAFDSAVSALVHQSHQRVLARLDTQSEGVFDRTRAAAFEVALAGAGCASSPSLLDFLWDVCRTTQGILTLGVLQDVVDYVALSHESLHIALDRQIARKVVPQLSGPSDAARALSEFLSSHSESVHFQESRQCLSSLLSTLDGTGDNVIFRY
jgi:AAA domain (dynein-related subfamily)